MKFQILVGLIILTISPLLAYDFAIMPGSDSWNSLESRAARVQKLQIPIGELSNMSTTELADACLKYPYNIEVWAYDSSTRGIQVVLDEFNGFSELFKRADAKDVLFEAYKALSPENVDEQWTSVRKGEFALRGAFAELLLKELISETKVEYAGLIDILKIAMRNYNVQLQKSGTYDILKAETTALLVSAVLFEIDKVSFPIFVESDINRKAFIETGRTNDFTVTSEILDYAAKALNK